MSEDTTINKPWWETDNPEKALKEAIDLLMSNESACEERDDKIVRKLRHVQAAMKGRRVHSRPPHTFKEFEAQLASLLSYVGKMRGVYVRNEVSGGRTGKMSGQEASIKTGRKITAIIEADRSILPE